MKLRKSVFVGLGALSLSLGCVTLDKPAEVAACAQTGTCSNEVEHKDASPDGPSGTTPDLRMTDEPSGRKDDLGEDKTPSDPDLGNRDSSGPDSLNPDLAADEAPARDLAPDAVASPDLLFETGPELRLDDVAADDIPKADVPLDQGKDDVPREDVRLDDVALQDVSPEAPRDATPTDVSYTACPAVYPVVGDHIVLGTTSAVCFVTCYDVQYEWGCDTFTEAVRAVKVNGTSVKCGGTLPPKIQPGNYYYFEVAAGGDVWNQIHWSGTPASSCTAPAGGFVP